MNVLYRAAVVAVLEKVEIIIMSGKVAHLFGRKIS